MENNIDMVKKNKMFSYFLFAFFILFLITGLLLYLNQKKQNALITNNNVNQVEKTNNADESVIKDSLVIPDEENQNSKYNLSLQTDSIDIKLGTIVMVDIYGDSNSKNIVGYDLVLKYNPLAFDYLKHEPIISDIKVYKYRKDSYLTLTGVRNLQSNPSPFSNSKLVTLYFEAKKIGTFDFSFVSSFDKTKTDFVTDNTEVLLPKLNNLRIEVR